MPTLKLKAKPGVATPRDDRSRGPAQPPRPPVRGAGSGVRQRPTLAEAQTQRAEREARYQEQLRQRYGEQAPEAIRRPRPDAPPAARRERPATGGPTRSHTQPMPTWDEPQAPQASARNTAFGGNDAVRSRSGNMAVGGGDADPSRGRAPASRNGDADRTRGRNAAFDSADFNRQRTARGSGGPARPVTPTAAPPASAKAPHFAQPAPRHAAQEPSEAGTLRLSKYMSELGIASRREADEWIAKGWVRVDGRVVSELGSRVVHGQHVTVDAKARHVQAQKVTVLINKPVGYVSGQAEDGYEPALVLVKPANQWRDDSSGTRFLPQHLRSLVPAGRLDIDSVGLLVLTQDGRVAKQLIGENSAVEKEYLVRVASPDGQRLSDDGLAVLRCGLELDGEALREAQVEWVNDDQLRFVLREGKKRQIRRMCDAVGLQVLGLKRVRIGRVMLGDLPAGQWRYLRGDEGF